MADAEIPLDDSIPPAKQCTLKERAFAEQYIIDLNGTQAVYRAGCFHVNTPESAAATSSLLLRRAHVRAFIEVLKSQRASRTNITADSVLHEMTLLSHSDLNHYVIADDGTVTLAEGAPEGAMRAIQRIKRRKSINEDKEGNVTITYDVELTLWDKPAPLRLVGRHVGLFSDRVEVTGKDGGPIETRQMSDVELAERAAALSRAAAALKMPADGTDE